MNPPVLSLVGLTKRFRGNAGPRRGPSRHRPGEVVALIGPSGCGKSTLLRAVTWLDPPDEGFVFLGGEPFGRERRGAVIRHQRPAPDRRDAPAHRAGFSAAQPWPHLSAPLDNVVRPQTVVLGRPRRRRSPGDATCSRRWASPTAPTASPYALSAGRSSAWPSLGALAMDPALMLFDEPDLGAGGPGTRRRVLALLRQLAAAGTTMLVVTHRSASPPTSPTGTCSWITAGSSSRARPAASSTTRPTPASPPSCLRLVGRGGRPDATPEPRDVPSRIDRPYTGIPSFLRAPVCPDPKALDGGGGDHRRAVRRRLAVPAGQPDGAAGSAGAFPALRRRALRPGDTGASTSCATRRGADRRLRRRRHRPTHVEATFANITENRRGGAGARALPVVLGGDHAITYRVLSAPSPQPAHILHFDAHMDYADEADGLRYTNATPSGTSPARHGAEPDPGRHPQPAQRPPPARGHRGRRQPGGADAGGPPPRPGGIAALIPAGAPVYVSIDVDGPRHGAGAGVRLGRAGRAELRRIARHPAGGGRAARGRGLRLRRGEPPLDVGTGATAYLGALAW